MKRRTGSVRLWAAAFWLLVWEGASLALAGTAAFWQAVAFSSLRILGGFLLETTAPREHPGRGKFVSRYAP